MAPGTIWQSGSSPLAPWPAKLIRSIGYRRPPQEAAAGSACLPGELLAAKPEGGTSATKPEGHGCCGGLVPRCVFGGFLLGIVCILSALSRSSKLALLVG